jgi:hypothetical protein
VKHINRPAVFMSAKFAHEPADLSSLCTEAVMLQGPDWFIDWAAKLIHHERSLKSSGPSVDLAERQRLLNIEYDKFLAGSFPYHNIQSQLLSNRPSADSAHPHQKFAPFNISAPWIRLLDLPSSRDFAYAVIALLSLNCSEASVERCFSQQKLTHGLLTNRKQPETVSRQLKIKWNERQLAKRGNRTPRSMRRVQQLRPEPADDEYKADEDNATEEDNDEISEDESDSDEELLESDGDVSSEDEQPAGNGARLSASRAPASFVHSAALDDLQNRPRWTVVQRLSSYLDVFCKQYISDNQLCLPRPFRRGGAKKLRELVESDIDMRREQFSDVQAHILHLLTNTDNPNPAQG